MKKIKEILKNNRIFILSLIIIFFVLNIKLPYYVDGPGGLIDMNDRYIIDNEYKVKGSFNMTYVSEYRANIALFLYSKINKNMDLYKKADVIPTNESENDSNIRGEIQLKEANDNAIIVAYNKAGKEVNIKSQKVLVIYVDKDAKTDIKVGDELISIDNNDISNMAEGKEIIKKHGPNEKITFKVKNNGKEYEKYAYVNEDKIIGIILAYEREFETNPSIKVKYGSNEYGPSGGLMTTLSIYNKLVPEDITYGYKIAGTGTIDENGNIGEIDGVKYKLKGAVKGKADIFFAPSGDNYNEAVKLKKKNNYKIDIVEVKTFDDALDYLYKIKRG